MARKQDLGDLAPERVLISTEPVVRVVGQIGEAQKALGKMDAGIGGKFCGLQIEAGAVSPVGAASGDGAMATSCTDEVRLPD